MSACIVRFFARARELAGADMLSVELNPGATVAELRQHLVAARPGLLDLLPRCALAIDGEFADDLQKVPPGAQIAVLPPVSGGMECTRQPEALAKATAVLR